MVASNRSYRAFCLDPPLYTVPFRMRPLSIQDRSVSTQYIAQLRGLSQVTAIGTTVEKRQQNQSTCSLTCLHASRFGTGQTRFVGSPTVLSPGTHVHLHGCNPRLAACNGQQFMSATRRCRQGKTPDHLHHDATRALRPGLDLCASSAPSKTCACSSVCESVDCLFDSELRVFQDGADGIDFGTKPMHCLMSMSPALVSPF